MTEMMIETNENQNNPSNLFKMLNESLNHKVNECLQMKISKNLNFTDISYIRIKFRKNIK